MNSKCVTPVVSVYTHGFKYIKAIDTDVSGTWRRYGWAPPDRQQQRKVKQVVNGL